MRVSMLLGTYLDQLPTVLSLEIGYQNLLQVAGLTYLGENVVREKEYRSAMAALERDE